MAVPIKFFLLICMVEIICAQFPEVDIGAISKGPTVRTSTRFFPRQPAPVRSNNLASSSVVTNQRVRRPTISLKNRPIPEPNEISSFTPIRPKPTFLPLPKQDIPTSPAPPPQLLQRDQPIKPVSEESKEDDINQHVNKQQHPQQHQLHPQQHQQYPQQHQQHHHHHQQQLNTVVIPQPQAFPQHLFSNPLTPRPEPIISFKPAINPVFTQPIQNPIRLVENIPPVQYRPQKPVKLRKPIDDDDEVHIPVKQQYQQSSISKQSLKKGGYREKKPVAQIVRRWREENDDGSINWGYENDDGSYKEEIIGEDCITRGKYGYIDADGAKREYTYETGIKCNEQEEEIIEGFVDYQENTLVLPNGKTIDLSNMGKKQGRRPQPIYRN